MRETKLDNFIGFFSPMAKLKRLQARAAMEIILKRKYDGAGTGVRLKNWKADGKDASSEIAAGLDTLRFRMRDLIRNNVYARKAVNVIVNNTVGGWGIIPQFKSENKRRANEAEKIFREWADNVEVDYDGRQDFYALQSLIARTIVSDGEVLIKALINPNSKRTIPLELQCLEADYLDTSRDTFSRRVQGQNFVLQGIEFTPAKKRAAYWLHKDHPGGTISGFGFRGFESERVSAENIIHPYMVERCEQIRGVPWGVASMVRCKDYQDYAEAQLMRQKIASCFAAFVVESEMPINADSAKSIIGESVQPGIIEILPPGRDIRFGSPPTVEGYGEFSRQEIMAIAVGFGVTYESISGDYGNVNFSSGRMGHLEFQRNLDAWRWQVIIPQVLNQIWAKFSQAAFVAGYDFRGVYPLWTPPRREMIDPVKETQAAKDQIRSGFKSLPETVRELGYDPEQTLKEISESNAKLDEAGIILDSDPRKISGGGSFQVDPESAESMEQGGDDGEDAGTDEET